MERFYDKLFTFAVWTKKQYVLMEHMVETDLGPAVQN